MGFATRDGVPAGLALTHPAVSLRFVEDAGSLTRSAAKGFDDVAIIHNSHPDEGLLNADEGKSGNVFVRVELVGHRADETSSARAVQARLSLGHRNAAFPDRIVRNERWSMDLVAATVFSDDPVACEGNPEDRSRPP